MSPADELEPVTVQDAGAALKKSPATIHVWAVRYSARKLGKQGRKIYYDLRDLKVIEREIYHGHPVPATWQERAAIRLHCPLRDAERLHVAA